MRSDATIECERCGYTQSIEKNQKSKFVQPPIYPDIFNEVPDTISLPLYVQLHHKGFWTTDNNGIHVSSLDENCNRNSVMLSPDCLLSVYKIALRHLLLSMGVIQPMNIDSANLVPHVVVRKNKDDPFSKYKSIQDEHFLISEVDLSSKSDFIMIELDKKRDLHMTLIYAKGIGKRIDLIDTFNSVIKLLNYRPDLIELYASIEYFGQKELEYWHETSQLYPYISEFPILM